MNSGVALSWSGLYSGCTLSPTSLNTIGTKRGDFVTQKSDWVLGFLYLSFLWWTSAISTWGYKSIFSGVISLAARDVSLATSQLQVCVPGGGDRKVVICPALLGNSQQGHQVLCFGHALLEAANLNTQGNPAYFKDSCVSWLGVQEAGEKMPVESGPDWITKTW